MTRPGSIAALALFVTLHAGAVRAQTPLLDPGPHPVGFTSVIELDRSRMLAPRTTFDGVALAGETATPVRVSMWYPADAAGTAVMTREAYDNVTRAQPVPRADLVRDWKTMLGFAGLEAADADLDAMLVRQYTARRDAPPRIGRFPTVLSSPALLPALGEYLASHGFVVLTTPSLPRTGTQQATRPAIALETETRNLEFLMAYARGLSFADTSRLGVIGVNFSGMAALVFEMRNMCASAVVSLDGWEGKANGRQIVSDSPYFDVVRMRTPYLLFVQDEAAAGRGRDRGLWSALKYSDRQWFVLDGFGHLFLTSDRSDAPHLPEKVRHGYQFVYRAVREFLDEHVKFAALPGPTRERPPAVALPEARRLALLAEEAHTPALAPVPTGEEFERLVMDGDIARAARIYLEARRADPAVMPADESTLNLYAFRYGQQKRVAEVLALRRLTAEAFPRSARAAFNLALALESAADPAARATFARVLPLVDADESLTLEEKARLRADVQQRLTGGAAGR